MKRDAATEAQVRAAEPGFSTWLSANAGSGKTRVLTDRVARLLLDEVRPDHILCLTYTKAAASEMQNRLFQRLGAWAMLDSDALRAELDRLGVEGRHDPENLAHARTLFARAIETPGGLRIQTIHSFCASLLRRFPLEAGISPNFTEIEDRDATLLREDVLDRMADGPEAGLVAAVARYDTGDRLSDLTKAIVAHRAAFAEAPSPEALKAALGLDPKMTETSLLETVFDASEDHLIAQLCLVLPQGGKTDITAAQRLTGLRLDTVDALVILESVFLTGSGAKQPFSAKIGAFPTKALRTGALEPDMPAIEALMERVEAARDTRLALAAAQRAQALQALAEPFLGLYTAEKQRRGWLDFDDLILKAGQLLSDPNVAEWVLYRLDGGIDHILVDEAQDTSPQQWQVIERLAQEFTSGQGARADIRRTIFVVGDKKQSIYSFQGADPREFDRMRADFAGRLRDTDAPLRNLTLAHSFRSASSILALVDATFRDQVEAGFDDSLHIAFKDAMPGRVDLWPFLDKTKDEGEEEVWYQPVDRVGPRHHITVLAERVATRIHALLHGTESIPDEIGHTGTYHRRAIRGDDILILVRGRMSGLFHEIIRACKARGLPMAGADRLRIGGELAVRDLAALLSVLATPEDDLSLACALRSPIFGLDEQDLFDLAHRRQGRFLWTELRNRRDDFPLAMAMFDDLMGQTDFLRPYDLIDRILTRHKGRRALLARLGQEAEDGIDALLAQALAFERTSIPSLTGFLQWMQTDEVEIKRQADSAEGRIRVMTVHGAKGLEAPIVILPDTSEPKDDVRDDILMLDGLPIWKPKSAMMPEALGAVAEDVKTAQRAERERLLYVAMTRAEKWLIVAGCGTQGEKGTGWYSRIESAMQEIGALTQDFGEIGVGQRLSNGDWDAGARATDPPPSAELPISDPLFAVPAILPEADPGTRSPSDLGGAKALPGETGDYLDSDETTDTEHEAKTRGSRIHLLLEHLPDCAQDGWEQLSLHLIGDIPERAALLAEAAGVMTAPALAEYMAPNALREVAVTAHLPQIDARIHGTIDRLIVTPDRVSAMDFKSNRIIPATPGQTPEGLLRQMGAYAAALAQIYPDRRIDTVVIWTHTAQLMVLPHDIVTLALMRTTTP